MKILITAPSLNMTENVSGISALVAPLVKNYPDIFSHLLVGTIDSDKSFTSRIRSLRTSLSKLILFRKQNKGQLILHLNTALDTKSVARDSFLMLIAFFLKFKVVLHLHGGYWFTAENINYFKRILVKILTHLPSKLIVLGEQEVDILKSRFLISRDINVLRNYVAPYFSDLDFSKNRQPKNLIFVGRLVSSKSVHRLAEIFSLILARHPDSHLLICGDGPLRKQLLDQLSLIPSSSWTYLGVVDGDDKVRAFRSSDVFILPSVSGEGLPVSMLEAMVCGCIPVVTNLGSIPSVIRNGINGFICEPGNSQQFADVVINLFDNTVDNKTKIRQNIQITSNGFSIDDYLKNVKAIYQSIF